jgi:hypothetical protein
MLPHKHAIISTAIGAIGWWKIGDIRACIAAVAAGVLPDLDHIADYSYYRWRGIHRLILPLHGYEYAVLGAIATLLAGNKILGVATVSYSVHLLADQMENYTHLLGYSLLFRARHKFRIEEISTVPEAAARGREDDIRALRALLRRLRTMAAMSRRPII